MASLIYGGGLRVSECCELRIKDIDIGQGLVIVRAGKGAKDRTTLLPESCRAELDAQLGRCQALHDTDRTAARARARDPRSDPWRPLSLPM
jgi:integrase